MEYGVSAPMQVHLSSESQRKPVEEFLSRMGLRLEPLDYYAVLKLDDEIIGGGGFGGNTIKCIAADQEARGMGITNILVSHLRSEMNARGVDNVFLFTKPENEDIFKSLAFYLVGRAPNAILMESARRGVSSLENRLAEHKKDGKTGAIVMNCNPFTLGHQYLIETAAREVENLVIFPVREDKSVFPYHDRLRLIKEGTAHLDNVSVLEGGDYIISNATFPTYFLKELSEASKTHALLDVDIFARHIAPPLNITVRFAGSEPLDPMTNVYNSAMLETLPTYGMEVKIIDRISKGDEVISASRVRRLLAEGKLDEIKALVPQSTYAYLLSEAGEAAAERERSKL